MTPAEVDALLAQLDGAALWPDPVLPHQAAALIREQRDSDGKVRAS